MTREYGKVRLGLALILIILLSVTGILMGLVVDAEDIDAAGDPEISYVEPDFVEQGQKFKIVGDNFGEEQGNGEARIGKIAEAESAELGQGRKLGVIKWSDEKIKVKLNVPSIWEGKIRYVWIEKDGKKTSFLPLGILPREEVLALDAVYPTLHKWIDPDLCSHRNPCSETEPCPNHCIEVELTGTGLTNNTRVSLYPDAFNKKAIIGSLPGYARGVTLLGDYAYLASLNHGLQIVNVSDLKNPSLASSVKTPGYAWGVFVREKLAYVADGSGLRIIDVTDPKNPRKIGECDTPGTAKAVDVQGTTAYVADFESGLQIIDVSDPFNPRIEEPQEPIAVQWKAMDVEVAGDIAYVANYYRGLEILNVEEPRNPVHLKTVPTPGWAWGVSVEDGLVFVADAYEGLQVVDTSEPSDASIIGSVPTAGRAVDVTVLGNRAYVADAERGLQIIDTTDPFSPLLIGTVGTPGTSQQVAVINTTVFVADWYSMQVIDASDPKKDTIIGSWRWPNTNSTKGVTVIDNIAYVADSIRGLQVIDVSDPGKPSYISSFGLNNGGLPRTAYARDVVVKENKAYLVGDNIDLAIIDVADPQKPFLRRPLIKTPGKGKAVAVVDNTAYVAAANDEEDNGAGLHVVDLATGDVIDSIPTPDDAQDVVVIGNMAYVAALTGGLLVIDLETSDIVDSIPTWPYKAEGLAVQVTPEDTTAFVAAHDGGLRIVDLDKLEEIGSIDTEIEMAWDVFVKDTTAFVADAFGGLLTIDVSDKKKPYIVGSVNTPGNPVSVTAKEDIVYVADGASLTMLRAPTMVPPSNCIPMNGGTKMCLNLESPREPGHYTLKVQKDGESDELIGALSFLELEKAHDSKAIIIAGGGPEIGGKKNTLWPATKKCANKAYDALLYQGYKGSRIVEQCNTGWEDNDLWLLGNADIHDRDKPATRIDLEKTIKEANGASELLIYMVDHGETDHFIIGDDGGDPEKLNVDDLDQWLDAFQENPDSSVIVIYDACQSGSFVSKLRPPDRRERIVITGSSEEGAFFFREGEDSFSYQFWEAIQSNGGRLFDAFLIAERSVKGYQTALIDADGDGLHNEQEDKVHAADKVIRRSAPPHSIAEPPTIGEVGAEIDSPTIGEVDGHVASFIRIWASGVDGEKSVQAQIIPPDYDSAISGLDTDQYEFILSGPDNDGFYRGVGLSATVKGTYIVTVKAVASGEIYSYVSGKKKTINIYSSPSYASVTQLFGTTKTHVEPDTYEQDDTFDQASIMVLNHTLQRHNFDNENDEDWVKFYAIRDARYTIKACDLTIVCNVGVTLHDAAGKEVPAPACEGDPGEDEWICKQDGEPGEDEWIDWTCRQEGVYYVRVKNENKNFGENTSYSLMVYQPTAPSLSVRVHGVVKDCNTGKPIEDVVIKTDQGISAMSGNKGSYIMPHMEWDNVTFTVQRERYSTCTCPKISVQDGLTVNFQLSASGEPKCPECCTAYVDTSKSTSRNGGGGGGGSGVG